MAEDGHRNENQEGTGKLVQQPLWQKTVAQQQTQSLQMFQQKIYADGIRERLIESTEKLAVDEGLVSADALESFQKAMEASRRYEGIISQNEDIRNQEIDEENRKQFPPKEERLQTLLQSLDIDEKDKVAISDLMALETVVLNAVEHFENACMLSYVNNRFTEMFEVLNEASNGKADDFQQRIKELIEIKNNMKVSLTHTMHPTVYHSKEAIELEQDITQQLEHNINGEAIKGRPIDAPHKRAPDITAPQIETHIQRFIKDMVQGHADITLHSQITVERENLLERENFQTLEHHINEVVEKWNHTIDNLQVRKPPLLTDKALAKQLKITDEDKERIFELRTWGRAADADGREQSTAIQLAQSIDQATRGDTYIGPKLDLRQNAELHTNLISALVQRKYRNSQNHPKAPTVDIQKFASLCEKFAASVQKENGFKDPTKSIYQEMDVEDRSKFMQMLLEEEVSLLPEELGEQSVAFTQKYIQLYKDFLKTNDAKIPLDENTSFLDLIKQRYNKETPSGVQSTSMAKLWRQHVRRNTKGVANEEEGFMLMESGLHFTPVDETSATSDYLQSRRKLDAGGHKVELGKEERHVLFDIPKRLFVIADAIDKFKDKVADRHQIANFGHEHQFYEAMFLFKETGLITIDKDQVTDIKMGIMPLLETLEDLKRAPQVFKNLLKDPMVRNYYKERGKAEFMIGFSDGGKSAGNFASEWQMYKTTRALNKLFKEEFKNELGNETGIETRFFEGRGRGYDRGGAHELGHHSTLFSDEVNASMIKDQTIQSDLPIDMRISAYFGIDQLASIMIGIINGKQHATHRTPDEKERLEDMEEAIDWIADKSAKVFEENVRKSDAAFAFIDGMPKNKNKSSRKIKRDATAKQDYEGIRAVANEYAAKLADLPYHNVGLNEALEEFKDSGIEVKDSNGNTVSGEEALKALQDHPFFNTMMHKIGASMNQYDSDVAYAYAEKIDEARKQKDPSIVGKDQEKAAEYFVENIADKLNKLQDTIHAFMHGWKGEIRCRDTANYTSKADRLHQLDSLGHAMLLSLPSFKPPDDQPDQQKILHNALFVNAAEVSHPDMSKELRQNLTASAAGVAI